MFDLSYFRQMGETFYILERVNLYEADARIFNKTHNRLPNHKLSICQISNT